MHQLEEQLRVKSFDRTKCGVEPTESGRVKIERARRIVTDIDNLQITARDVSYGMQDRIAAGYRPNIIFQGTSLESVLDMITGKASRGAAWPDLHFGRSTMPGASRRLDFAIYWHDLALKHFFKLVEERHFGGAVSLKKRLFQDERLFEVYLEVLESAATESLDSQR